VCVCACVCARACVRVCAEERKSKRACGFASLDLVLRECSR